MTEPGPSALRRLAELPQRLFLTVVSAGVIGSLTIAAGAVWIAAVVGRWRR